MIACLDTDYRDDKAQCACVVLEDWTDTKPFKLYRVEVDPVAPYEPGAFFKRELPGLLKVLSLVAEPLDFIVIDGFVLLGENRSGLGLHLFQSLHGRTPVIGVAKSSFQGAENVAHPLIRGTSKQPLWITAVGAELDEAVAHIQRMAGPHRIPAMLKAADAACREW